MEQTEVNGVEKLEKIVFRAANTKKQQAVKVGPLQDKTGRLYTGQGPTGYYESLTQKDRDELPIGMVFDHNTVYVVEDGKVLDLSDPVDAAMWKWIQKHPYIGLTKEDCSARRDAVFYVDNPQKKAESFVSRDKKVTKVKTMVYNANSEEKINAAKALGLTGAEGLKIPQVEEWLIIEAERLPDAVESLLDPKNAGLTVAIGIVKEMLMYNIIKRFGTVYKYGGRDGITLGTSDEEAAEWVLDTKNEDAFIAMKFNLDEQKGLA